MDKIIEKKGRPPLQWVLLAAGAVAVAFIAWQLFARTGNARLRVDSTRLTTAVVEKAQFREYYPFDSTVQAANTVYLDVEQGGRVEKMFFKGGEQVQKGDLILRFDNVSAQRSAIETETRLLDTLDTYRNTEFTTATSSLQRQDQLLDMDHQIQDLEAKVRRYDTLMKSAHSPVSVEEYEKQRDQLKYLKSKRELMAERIRQEDIMSNNRLELARRSITRVNENRELLNRSMEAMEVRAPVSGTLSTIDAEMGQNVPMGKRIGQIDEPGGFKLRARIDQAYNGRVQPGTPGHVAMDGKDWEVKVQKVYPEVKQNIFEADVVFADQVPPSLKPGQTVTVDLTFSSPVESLIVAKGSFYQHTAGRWVYLVAADGKSAHRVDVKLGRQNPRQVEVLEGLRVGDRIIASGYDGYNDIEQLTFSEAIPPQQGKP
ncbi:MAG: HlyD family efflux transporter periplasmic adaptor subunit [Steroidobacteraceae bacterium]